MLKIKDFIDLKELENFGFKDEQFCYIKDFKNYKKDKQILNIWVEKSTRNVGYYIQGNYIDLEIDEELNILFDLIQAGNVEKVEEV